MFYKANLVGIFQDTLKGHKELQKPNVCSSFTPVVVTLLYKSIVKLITLLPLNRQEASKVLRDV